MKILFFGDVMGRAGRDAVCKHMPSLRAEYGADFILVNGENSAAGYGMTPTIANEFLASGIDALTTGDHVWDQKELVPMLANDKRLVRAANFPANTPGRGHHLFELAGGKRVLVLHLMCQVFMRDYYNSPFEAADAVLEPYQLGKNVDAILVDVHGEATSEKNALGHYLDGRVSLVVGTHTHVPTADARIFPKGTAYQTDAGMCGDYDSVIGMRKDEPISAFLKKMRSGRFVPADGEVTLCGVMIETNDKGLATTIKPIRRGGHLSEQA